MGYMVSHISLFENDTFWDTNPQKLSLGPLFNKKPRLDRASSELAWNSLLHSYENRIMPVFSEDTSGNGEIAQNLLVSHCKVKENILHASI